MSSLKLQFKNENRRVLLTRRETLSYDDLLTKVFSLFPLTKDRKLILSWIDEDGDKIIFSTDDELNDAIHHQVKFLLKSTIKITIEIAEQSEDVFLSTSGTSSVPATTDKTPVVHENVMCDECGAKPIVGPRFKCSVRENFDLCAACESKQIQPFPMIKIYHPDQNPLAVLIAVRDDEDGFHGRRGRHHGGGGHHPRGGPGPFRNPGCPGRWTSFGPRVFPGEGNGQPPFPKPEFGPFSSTTYPPNRVGKWARNAAKTFVEAMDAVASGLNSSGDSSSTKDNTTVDESVETEQTLVDEAIRLSIEETLSADASASNPIEMMTPTAGASSAGASEGSTEKLKSRFVKDVTFPDGTTVQPGTVFLKVWRVRNVGSDWTEGTVLVPSGGDLLSPPDIKVPVPLIPAGQEGDISIQLSAPKRTGRHIAYFRLQQKDGTSFGQRLWSDIQVAVDEAGWQVVSGILQNTSDVSESASEAGSFIVGTEDISLLTSGNSEMSSLGRGSEASSAELLPRVVAAFIGSKTSADTVVIPSAALNPPTFVPDDSAMNSPSAIISPASSTTVSQAEAPRNVSPTPISTADMAIDIWARVYETELRLIRDMGFTDTAVIIPLLREHVGLPVSQNPELRGIPKADSIQRVVLHLLNASVTA